VRAKGQELIDESRVPVVITANSAAGLTEIQEISFLSGAQTRPASGEELQVADPRHHVASDALEGPQHELMITHHVAHH
jgi:hypothetical protein